MKKSSFIIKCGVAAVSLILSVPLFADLQITGDVEIDTTHKTTVTNSGAVGAKDVSKSTITESGRGAISFASTKKDGDNYAEGKVGLEFGVDGSTTVTDTYVKLGNAQYDVQIGAFEGIWVYSYGQDVVVEKTAAGVYEVDFVAGRRPADLAFHYVGLKDMVFELKLKLGTQTTTVEENIMGYRPAFDLTFGQFQVVGAYESVTSTPSDTDVKGSTTKSGYGLLFKGTFGNVTTGLNYTAGITDSGETYPDPTATPPSNGGATKDEATKDSMGLFVTVAKAGPGDFGLGYHLTNTNDGATAATKVDADLMFLSYALPVYKESAWVKLGYSMANQKQKQDGNTAEPTEKINATRLRIDYIF